METRANHVLVGAFTLLAVAVAVAFGLWTARFTASADWAEYEIRFTQAVTGLNQGSTVQYNGIGVGTVLDLRLAPEDARQVIARIRIHSDAPVKEDTEARLQLAGLTGTTFIQLTGGSPSSPHRKPLPGQDVPVIPAAESALDKLFGASEGIAESTNEVLLRLVQLLSEENTQRIGDSLANIQAFTETLRDERGEMQGVFKNVSSASASAERALQGAERTIAQLNDTLVTVNAQLIERLPALSEDMSLTLQQLAQLTARADQLLAENADAFTALGPSGLGQLGPTLQELQILLQDLSRTTRRFDRNPAGFLLGGSQAEEFQP
jgi:phospholipid/cholesterol/gamma-HCH transport system substrate-binding protein